MKSVSQKRGGEEVLIYLHSWAYISFFSGSRYNMLGLAKRVKARFLLASTSEIYGSPKEHPQNEEYWGHVNCFGPRACYDEGKRVAEALTYSYARQDGVDVRIARIFNTFGMFRFVLFFSQSNPSSMFSGQEGKKSKMDFV
jgi:nucleoside-diphosphate-sugar epimerase